MVIVRRKADSPAGPKNSATDDTSTPHLRGGQHRFIKKAASGNVLFLPVAPFILSCDVHFYKPARNKLAILIFVVVNHARRRVRSATLPPQMRIFSCVLPPVSQSLAASLRPATKQQHNSSRSTSPLPTQRCSTQWRRWPQRPIYR